MLLQKLAVTQLPEANQSEQSELFGRGGLKETGAEAACFRQRLN